MEEKKENLEEHPVSEEVSTINDADSNTEVKDDSSNKVVKKKSKKKRLIIFVIVVLIFLLIGAFFVYKDSKETKTVKTKKNEVKSEYAMSGNDIQNFDLAFLKLENGQENKIYSPLSIKYALSMLSDAANGDSKSQIDAVIGKYSSKKYTNSSNLSLANAMFIKDSFKSSVKESYTKNLSDKYNAEVIYDSFESTDTINNWVSEKTLKLVNNLLDSPIKGNDFFLVNALAIDMEWTTCIQNSMTCKNNIYYHVSYDHEKYSDYISALEEVGYHKLSFNNDSSNVKSVQFGATINNYDIVKEVGEDNMRTFITQKVNEYLADGGSEYETQSASEIVENYIKSIDKNYNTSKTSTDFQFYNDDNVKVFAKDLQTYDNTTLQYIGIMPKNTDLDSYVKDLKANDISKLISNLISPDNESLPQGKIYKITGYMPEFKFDYKLDFENDLKSLGITDIFDASTADLTNMLNGKGEFISDAIHKADITFSNNGIKAGAVSVGGGAGSASGGFDYLYDVPIETIDLTFDQPYLFLIRDKDTGEVWFTGTVYNPTLY